MVVGRRGVLMAGAACLMPFFARAEHVAGKLPWQAYAGTPPDVARPGPWLFFEPEEGRAVEAFVDRLIPADELSPRGTECGSAVYIDRQLAGPYGSSAALYMRPPFRDGAKSQGDQSPLTPAMRYRRSLAALDLYCRAGFAGKVFADLPPDRQDQLIAGLEANTVHFDDCSGKAFFELILKDTQQGFLADPIYGGNRDMVAWRMIGFPGARYDYRDWIDRHNEAYPYPPTSIGGQPAWSGAAKD